MTRRYRFTITTEGVVEVHVPDDDDCSMEGAGTPAERDAVRLESARGDLDVNLDDVVCEILAAGRGVSRIEEFVETTDPATVEPL